MMSDVKSEQTIPVLRIRFEDGAGKSLIDPIEIKIPRELSARVAKLHLIEMLVKAFKPAIGGALKSMGFK
jgi:hypothetical protein